ncbi:tetratricopeptide repeat protein [candidate division CSSED10-310 bacterium]|uniref:Tetratricopeptide repeat protein n=1 Tax=candidate division CSSED10-310 bacterium TaxID=2855610 RepID=A0ABV6YUM9_UNCC1
MNAHFLDKVMIKVILVVFLFPCILWAAPIDNVLTDAQDGTLDNFTILEAMLIAADFPAATVSQLKADAAGKIAAVANTAGPEPGKEIKLIDSILKNLKAKLLKQYWPGSSLKDTLDQNKFDPLWGTGIFLETLSKSKLSCKVIETPANFLISFKDSAGETMYDIFLGKNPIKTNFNDYISKSAGLRSSFQVKNFPPFRLNSAERYNYSRILVGVIQQRLMKDIQADNFSDFQKVQNLLTKTFKNVIIDQDKLIDTISKRIKNVEEPKQALQLIKIADSTAKQVQINTKELNDNAILAARKSYLNLKNKKAWPAMESYLKDLKPLVPNDVYLPMAKEGYLNIHNHYWAKKDYPKVEYYANKLIEVGITKAKSFWAKAVLLQAQELAKNKKYSQALAKCDTILKKDKNNANALKIREWIYLTQYEEYKTGNKYREMLKVLATLDKLYPAKEDYQKGMVRTYWTWGDSYIQANDIPNALKVLNEGCKKFKDSKALKDKTESTYYNYSVVLYKKGQFEKAIGILKDANVKFGEESDLRNNFIGDCYLKASIAAADKGDIAKAMAYAEKGQIYAPDNTSLKNQMENLKRGKGSVKAEEIEIAPWE